MAKPVVKSKKIFFDTEFYEGPSDPNDPHSPPIVDLISIGLVTEDGKKLYLVSKEFDATRAAANPFLRDEVLPRLKLQGKKDKRYSRDEMRQKITEFVAQCCGDESPQFWAYSPATDFYAFYQLVAPNSTLMHLPEGWDRGIRNIRQLYSDQNIVDMRPPKRLTHNALEDAEWTRDAYAHFEELSNKANKGAPAFRERLERNQKFRGKRIASDPTVKKYFLDTEFYEGPSDPAIPESPHVIDLISLSLISEDGEKLDLVSSQFDAARAATNDILAKHTLPHLKGKRMTRPEMRDAVIHFMDKTGVAQGKTPQIWGNNPVTDFIAFYQLVSDHGKLVNFPKDWDDNVHSVRQLYADQDILDMRPKAEYSHQAPKDAALAKKAEGRFRTLQGKAELGLEPFRDRLENVMAEQVRLR